MSTEQELIENVKELGKGRIDHLYSDMKCRMRTAIQNGTVLESVNIPVHWMDLAPLLRLAVKMNDGELEEYSAMAGDEPLTFTRYQEGAKTTAIYPGNKTITGLCYAALGLGEAGEVQGKVKKILRDDSGVLSPEKRKAISKELGDILWYLAAVADEIDVPLSQIADDNYRKLTSRMERGKLQGSGDER